MMSWVIIIAIAVIAFAVYVHIDNKRAEEESKRNEERERAKAEQAYKLSTAKSGRGYSQASTSPSITVSVEAPNRHDVDPRCLRPVKGLKEYVTIYSSAFLPPEHQLDLVTVSDDGSTNLKLGLYNGQMVLEAPNGILPSTGSCQTYKIGIYSAAVRGTSYYEKAITRSDTSPLTPALLVREYDNKYDKNAVAIHTRDGGLVGYVNKQNAARLAKRIEAGEDYSALFTCGAGRGVRDPHTTILIAPVKTMRSILRNSRLDESLAESSFFS